MAEVILALDLPDAPTTLAMVDRLPGLRWVKVGSILMTREGPGLVRALRERGLEIFLDLKWHDIPNTVAGAVAAARGQGVRMATVHTLGGSAMMRAAVEAAAGEVALVGVTVLTSHDHASFGEATGRGGVDLGAEAQRLASLATAAGLRGVVCSPLEVAAIRAALGPEAWIVVPGIRRGGDTAGDQVRIAGPGEAVAAGATHLVVGRPILEAGNPAAALADFLAAAS